MSLFTGTDTVLSGTASGLTRQIQISGITLENMIVQDIQASVNVTVQTYYEIGSKNSHRVAGRPQGSGSMSNVIGPTSGALTMCKVLCDICNPRDLNVNITNACANSQNSIKFKDAIATGLSMTMNAAQDLVNASWTLMFSDAEQV